jgi:putative heme-binding domain-containing protein
MNLRWADTTLAEKVKTSGVYDPDQVTIVPAEMPARNDEALIPVDTVLALRGDAVAGADKAAACRLCHHVGGAGVNYGPALDGWVSRQGVEQAILAIVNPHADIAHGYEGHRVALKDGGNVYGIVSASGDPVVITSMGGLRQMIPADRVERVHRHWDSLMLSADQLGLSAQDVADIVAYLRGE